MYAQLPMSYNLHTYDGKGLYFFYLRLIPRIGILFLKGTYQGVQSEYSHYVTQCKVCCIKF